MPPEATVFEALMYHFKSDLLVKIKLKLIKLIFGPQKPIGIVGVKCLFGIKIFF